MAPTAAQAPTGVSAVDAGFSLWTFGSNTHGQVQNSYNTPILSPFQAVSSGVVDVSCGYLTTHFIKNDGSLWGMGINSYGQLGHSNTGVGARVPTQANGTAAASGVIKVIGGGSSSWYEGHTHFLRSDGTLWGMGLNNVAQLGDNSLTNRSTPVLVNMQGNPGGGVVDFGVGSRHSMFVKANGTLWGMGRNANGQLGNGTTSHTWHSAMQTGSSTTVTQVSCGGDHSLFIDNGSLWAMGDNSYGQLGDGTTTQRNSPVQITGAWTTVTHIYASNRHSLFLTTGGNLWAMGRNLDGQLGDGTTTDRTSPVPITQYRVGYTLLTLAPVTKIFSRGEHSGFLTASNMYAMGQNTYGQLGDGTTTYTPYPEKVYPGAGASVLGGAAGGIHGALLE